MHNRLYTSPIATSTLINSLPSFSAPPTQPPKAPINLLQHMLSPWHDIISSSLLYRQPPFNTIPKPRYVYRHTTITSNSTQLKRYNTSRYRLAPPGLEIPEGQLLIYAHDDSWPSQEACATGQNNSLVPPKEVSSNTSLLDADGASKTVYFEYELLYPDHDVEKLRQSWKCQGCWRDYDFPSSAPNSIALISSDRRRVVEFPVYDGEDKLCGECISQHSNGWLEYLRFRQSRCEELHNRTVDGDNTYSGMTTQAIGDDVENDRNSTVSVQEDDMQYNREVDSSSDGEVDEVSSIASLSTCLSSWNDYEDSMRSMSTTPSIASATTSLSGLEHDALSFQGHDEFKRKIAELLPLLAEVRRDARSQNKSNHNAC